MATQPLNYLTTRGLLDTAPATLNKALQTVLDSMESIVYGDPDRELTAGERAALKGSGFSLKSVLKSDSFASTAVKFAAICERSLSSKTASVRLGLSSSRIRQMTADRSLYSFLVGRDRYIPDFQFDGKRLVANIEAVNRSLRPDLHPVELYNWYHLPHPDLFLRNNIEQTSSPLDWLKSGQDVKQLIYFASRL